MFAVKLKAVLIFSSVLFVSCQRPEHRTETEVDDADAEELKEDYELLFSVNGEFQPGINLPQGPVNDPGEFQSGNSPPIIDPIGVHGNYRPSVSPRPTNKPGQPIGPLLPPSQPPVVQAPRLPDPGNDDLYKYCLRQHGQFPSRYCNAFVNCWDSNVVEQFCGATLVFNPKGFCDYAWNVNCHGKPIKNIPTVTGSNGWPTDGSYVPPPSPALPPGPKPTVTPVRPVYHEPITPTIPWTHPTPPGPPAINDHPKPGGGGIFTIEPPGFPDQEQDYIPPHPTHRPVRPPPTPTHHPTTTTTWRPTIVTFPTPSTPDLKKYCLHPRGQFAGPHCHRFINCWDDVAIEQDCPYGLHFNPHKHYCDFPHNYPCITQKDSGNFEYQQNQHFGPQGNELGF